MQLTPIEVSGLVISETLHERGLYLSMHHHERASLNITLIGCYAERFRGAGHRHPALHAVVKPPGETHSNHFVESTARSLLIEIESARLDVLRRSTSLFDGPRAFDASPFRLTVRRICAERRRPDALSPLVIESLLLDLFVQIDRRAASRIEGGVPTWLIRAREAALSKPPQERFSLRALAASVGVHPAHLARTFRAKYGSTIGEFVREARLRKAAERLADSADPITEIALSAGFFDQSHFAKAFRRAFGVTPLQARRLCLKVGRVESSCNAVTGRKSRPS